MKSAPGLGRDEGPDGPRPAGTLVEGVGGRIDEGVDEDGVLTEVLLLILQNYKQHKVKRKLLIRKHCRYF